MDEIIKSISKLSEQGYIEIEHHETFVIAKSRETGKYYLFDAKELKPIEGSESEQIKIHDRSTIFMVQNGSINTITIPSIRDGLDW